MKYVLESPYIHLVAFTAAIWLAVQAYKSVMRRLGWRSHVLVERTLPAVPVVLGLAFGAALGDVVGLSALVRGDAVPASVGAFYGAGVGFVASGLFRAVKVLAPDGGKIDQVLEVYQDGSEE